MYSNERRTPDALTADIFALVIMKLSGFYFHPVNLSRNSRFTSVVSIHRKMNT